MTIEYLYKIYSNLKLNKLQYIINIITMDDDCKKILNLVGIHFNDVIEIEGIFFPRDQLLSDSKYEHAKKYIPELKKKFSSSFMTSLQDKASFCQKWPLLNLVRQILSVYNFNLVPIRKCDGYTPEGIKKYKRFFKIVKKIQII